MEWPIKIAMAATMAAAVLPGPAAVAMAYIITKAKEHKNKLRGERKC